VETFGRYSLIRRLGAGGMGEVFLARAGDSPEALVLKRILPHLTENPRFLRLFLDETRIASRLTHPNIARIHELGEFEGTWFVAMEHVDGKDLRELLKRARELGHHVPLEVAVAIAIEVARGLAYAHAATDAQGRRLRVVHRDVSPHNILVARDGRVKLIDFGVAKAANKSVHTATGILKGKFPYMSPEQAHARPVDPRTDVFALGIVLWEMVCARYLFRGKTDAATLKLVREAVVPSPSSLRDDVPEALERVLLKALRKDQKDRYQSADAFREALESIAASLPPPELPRWLREYDDVAGFDDEADSEAFASKDPRPSKESKASEETQLESHEQPTVADSPSRATNPVRPRPTRNDRSLSLETPSDERTARLKELLSQVAGRPTNIGPQATSFVGRVAELADLHQLFRQGARLITLLGPGGTGKTRVSLQFGSQLVTWFDSVDKGRRRGGVWFCALTEANDRDSVCAAVARALGVPLAPGDAVKQLGHAIAARGETLLVIDNFEQVVSVAQETLGVWMKAAPQARFVVTSRELLRVEDETVFEVPPLRTPKASDQDVRNAESVQLFIERAQVARPGWEPTAQELTAISELVRQLDGMPLAIELAAGRVGVLSPAQLVQRLPQRFALLVDRRGAVERQATLRGAIDWSWNNLTPDEASCLAQLSVFRGGFSADVVEDVVRLPQGGALGVLMTLRAKSLVRAYFPTGDEQQTRFGLYETIREYALEKLQQLPEKDGALQRHAQVFLSLGKRLSVGADASKAKLDELDLERENLSAVFQRGIEAKRVREATLAALALDPVLNLRGPFAVQLSMLDAVLALEHTDDALHAAALEARARARLGRGRIAEAEDDLVLAESLADRSKDSAAAARVLFLRGLVDRLSGQRGDASARLEAAVERLGQVGDEFTQGRALSILASLRNEMGAETRALEAYNEALEIHRRVGDRRYEGVTLANLGVQQQALGLLKQARANYQAALAIHRELGNRRSEGISHINLGDLAAELEQPGQALAHYETSLQIVREVGARRFEGISLFSLGALHLQYGEYEDADRRISDAIQIHQEVGDTRHLGLALAIKAAVMALTGEVEAAEAQIAEGARLLTEQGDAAFLDALDLYRGHLELARSVQTGSPKQAAVLQERVQKRIAHAERPGLSDEEHPSGTPSPADRSEHVRAALRSLRGALADHDQSVVEPAPEE
jgi:predicted ATPase/serine/threonine protein kinase